MISKISADIHPLNPVTEINRNCGERHYLSKYLLDNYLYSFEYNIQNKKII